MPTPITRLNKFGQLSPWERWLFIRSILLLPILHTGLRVLGYSRLQALLVSVTPFKGDVATVSQTEIIEKARGIARIVSIAAQHGLYKATCLRRSLLVWWFLREQGIPGQVCFGVRVIDSHLEAHAWVEVQGMVINDTASVRDNYKTLEGTLPPTTLGL